MGLLEAAERRRRSAAGSGKCLFGLSLLLGGVAQKVPGLAQNVSKVEECGTELEGDALDDGPSDAMAATVVELGGARV